MRSGIRLAITGSSGYLAQELLRKLQEDSRVSFILGVDVRPPKQDSKERGYAFEYMDVRDGWGFEQQLVKHQINAVMHLAWVFNPQHDRRRVYEVDVLGSRNVFEACRAAKVKRVIYAGSTTAYGPWPDNPDDIWTVSEQYPRRGHFSYQYSRDKEIVDAMALQFMLDNPEIEFTLFRASIVMGPHTDNIVTYVMKLPAMFRIWGYDPVMQFVGEEDMQNLLYQAVVADHSHGVYNVAGDAVMRYSEICKLVKEYLGKPTITLPAAVLYPVVNLLWKLRILRFSSGLLDFIRYSWAASNYKLKTRFDFHPRQSTKDALLSYLRARQK